MMNDSKLAEFKN